MRLLALLLAACAVGPAPAGDAGAPDAAPLADAVTDPCECGNDPVCLWAFIAECGTCESFYCPGYVVSACQRPCLPPEP